MKWASEAMLDDVDPDPRPDRAWALDGAPVWEPEPTRFEPVARLATGEVSRHAARLVAIDRASERCELRSFGELPALLRDGDLVVVNDAATLPGSLRGRTETGADFELRLSGPIDGTHLEGVVLGEGDWRTRTEDRAVPPALDVGSHVHLGTVEARVVAAIGRRVVLEAATDRDDLWKLVYTSGTVVQYAHRTAQLPLYEVQTAYASRPWAAEMPSAGRPLTWDVLLRLRRAGIEVTTLTHAAGLSSTGDPALDRALPWPERYEIPLRSARAIARTRERGGRIIAIGTTVVRALEASGGAAGPGVATLRLDARHALRVVDGLVSGLHVPGESHFELLSAFAPRERLHRALALATANGLSGHELGDGCLIV
jgi:S-adenosylmethionine:tRNA ribosyltransferase-isomerase